MHDSQQPRRMVRLVATELIQVPDHSSGRIRSAADAAGLLTSFIGTKDREHLVAIHLSAKNTVLGMEVISIGDQSSAPAFPREVFKAAISMNAASLILGHNHPSGDITPSPDDKAVYNELVKVGEILGIPISDFIVVAGDRWTSFSGLA